VADDRVAPAGLGARDTLRLEACYPLHGSDIDATTGPAASALGFAAPAALGERLADAPPHAALARRREARTEPRLVPLLVTGRGIPRAGCDVVDQTGDVVGRVTSGTMSPTLRRGIALARVEPAHAA